MNRTLAKGTVMRAVKGIPIRCFSGVLWITWRMSGDVILRPGEGIIPRKKALVEALTDSAMGIGHGVESGDRRRKNGVSIGQGEIVENGLDSYR